MNGGCTGKILKVNLTEGTTSVESPGEQFYRLYYGGRSLIAYYLLREMKAGADPLGPQNVLVFAAGPITGGPFAGSGRSSVGARSPLTGAYGDGEAGGYWGVELKRAGFDAVVFSGRAEKPVYLWVHDGATEIRDASELWGLKTAEVEEAIKAQVGEKQARVAQCGPGGERLVRYACVAHDLTHFAGRGGMGAVMGSKNLRAVAVRGSQPVPMADPDAVRELGRWFVQRVQELSGGMQDTGTPGVLLGLNVAGGLPTRNFRQGHFEGADKISGPTLRDTLLIERETCYACPIRCKRVVKTGAPYHVDPVYGGPEYESLASLGSLCGVDDLEAVCKANELCGAFGLDTISAGVAIAFAMECYEEGILTPAHTGGLELSFGNGEAVVEMVRRIAHREGLGDLLAEGVKRASERLGAGARRLAMHIKGQEIPMHEPRLKHGLGLGYAVSPTGADHCHNLHDTVYAKPGKSLQDLAALGILEPLAAQDLSLDKVRLYTYITNWRTFANCSVHCLFIPWDFEQTAQLVRGMTGWNATVFELMKVGERAVNLTRCFNLREGFNIHDDYLPDRFYQAFESGPLQGVAVSRAALEQARLAFYRMSGWTDDGVPTREKLHELGLGWLVPSLDFIA